MLIIEGSDCLGKTTFAKKLEHYCAQLAPTFYSHMTKQNVEKFNFFYDYKSMIQSCIIMDRFHLGTLAYPDNKMTKDMLQQIEQWIYEKAGYIIILYASDENWYKEILNKDKRLNLSTETKERMFQANKIYKSFAEHKQIYYLFQPKFDLALDIKPMKEVLIQIPNYPIQVEIISIGQEWLLRRQLLNNEINDLKKDNNGR